MADPPDPYKVLQVDPEADPEVIQAAYRRLAQKYHPDLAADGDAARRMVAINDAWAILRDPETRAALDRRRALGARKPGGPAQSSRDTELFHGPESSREPESSSGDW